MYDEYFGPDVMGEDVMGVLPLLAARYARSAPGLSRLMPGRGGRAPAPTLAMRGPQGYPGAPYPFPPLPQSQGMPTARLRSYLGMGTIEWTGAADSALKQAQNTLQESFRPERLIIVEAAAGGTPAGVTLLNQVFAGTMPQSPSISTGTPVAMFASNATYSAVDMQIVWRGTQLTVQCSRSAAPGAGVTVTLAIGFYGQWIR